MLRSTVFVGVFLAAVAACRENAQPAPASVPVAGHPDAVIDVAVIPQSHDVPAGHVNDVRRLFESGAMSYPIPTVSAAGPQTQFVQPKPVFFGDTRFVVGLPKHAHEALDALLEQLPPATAGASGTFELTYWVIEAAPAAQTTVTKDIEELAPTLEGLKGLGPRKFRALDRVSSQLRDGTDTLGVNGRITEIGQRVVSIPDALELHLDLKVSGVFPDRNAVISTTLQAKLDKPVVLGDTAQAPSLDGTSTVILYVVRAHRVD
jgi:hypothetical protein